jgi:hypothetical protein
MGAEQDTKEESANSQDFCNAHNNEKIVNNLDKDETIVLSTIVERCNTVGWWEERTLLLTNK